MYYLETGPARDTRFRNALVLALAIHAALIASVSFKAGGSMPRHASQIEVTLAMRPSDFAPEDANTLAQANQEGGGEPAESTRVSSRDPLPAQAPAPGQALPPQQTESRRAQRDTLTTTAMASRIAPTLDDTRENSTERLEGISPEVDRLNRELASLQAELDEQTMAMTDRPRVRRLTAASARQSADAAYLLDWRRRLEAVGNKYYPEASIRYGIFGNVRLLVVIRQDGSLEEVRVLSSSGYAVLDEAAIKVVRMAAPFAPFPPELRATTDKLEIVRTWQYIENQLSSN